ncbi:MAG: phosphotransferase family protein [Polyangiaceae bacterium]
MATSATYQVSVSISVRACATCSRPSSSNHLARLHSWDWRHGGLASLDVPAEGTTQALEWNLGWWNRVWEEDSHRDIPLLRLAAGWLRDHMPTVRKVVLNHGDYRAGNFLYAEDDERITAWLDWELGHLGDYHEDVAYVTLPYLTHVAEDGVTVIANGMLPVDAFYAAYERASGLTLDPETIEYYHIYHAYRAAVIVLATGYRASINGKTHQDLLLNWIMGLGYVNLELIRKMLVART